MLRPGRAAILTYHSLDESGSVLSVSPRVFAAQMRTLHQLGARVVGLSELRQALAGARPPERLVALTFDDGFRNFYECGFPILQQYGFTATVFVVTDYCGKTNGWPGQPASVERRPLLEWRQIAEMSQAGIAFGCHTCTHPDLRRITEREAEEELDRSRRLLEDVLGRTIESFAYPYGFYNAAVRRLAQARFALACSAWLGFADARSDPLALERLDVYYLRRPLLFRRLFAPETDAYLQLRRGLRDLRARVAERAQSSHQPSAIGHQHSR
jgi:peptidoglycan/xylan/chitin deacetylase (PgdA/CDA1 family)